MDFVYFPPRSDIEQLQVRATKMLATWSVLSLLVLCPLYYHGANYMKCGKLWLRGTIAYVSDDHIIEYGTAIAACCYVAFVAVSLQRFEHSIPKFNQNTWCLANVSFVAIWVPILTLLSLPSFVYAAGTALPAHNTLGLSSTVLAVFQNDIGAILYLISSVVIPFLADKASIWADCESEQLRGRAQWWHPDCLPQCLCPWSRP